MVAAALGEMALGFGSGPARMGFGAGAAAGFGADIGGCWAANCEIISGETPASSAENGTGGVAIIGFGCGATTPGVGIGAGVGAGRVGMVIKFEAGCCGLIAGPP